MNWCPEPRLEPPEPVQVDTCPVCGGEIYAGDVCWEKDGDIICEWHLGDSVAEWLGWHRVEAE
jgi:hypothetical protein